jgi:hypothetical protein
MSPARTYNAEYLSLYRMTVPWTMLISRFSRFAQIIISHAALPYPEIQHKFPPG